MINKGVASVCIRRLRSHLNISKNATYRSSKFTSIAFNPATSSPTNPSAQTYLNRPFVPLKKPQLVLISGCTGSGKSTFSMLLSQQLGVIKCVSTDTIRLIARNYDTSPAIQRSSFNGSSDDAIKDWNDSCDSLDRSVNSVIDDSIKRGESLILEGVLIRPSNDALNRWINAGGSAIGIIVTINDEAFHKSLLIKRGESTSKGSERQLSHFHKIRMIHDEVKRLGQLNEWLAIDQEASREDPVGLVLNHIKKVNT